MGKPDVKTFTDENGRVVKLLDDKKLSLTEWLELVDDNPEEFLFADYCFPTEEHMREYIATIDQRDDESVKRLLRKFLIHSSHLQCDEDRLRHIEWYSKNDKKTFEKVLTYESTKRLLQWHFSKGKTSPPWEGITWALDLLPNFPKYALEVLQGYLVAHGAFMPDGRISGLSDTCEIIRAKYIGIPETQEQKVEELFSLSPRDFEYLVEKTFRGMGYQTELTKPVKDGGRDIIAKRGKVGHKEKVLVECKLHRHKIGVQVVRSLFGVVADEKVNKGIVVSTSKFTKGAVEFSARNPKIELIDGGQLVSLMNEHIGPTWPGKLEKIIAECLWDKQKKK
jgi:restriction system protein